MTDVDHKVIDVSHLATHTAVNGRAIQPMTDLFSVIDALNCGQDASANANVMAHCHDTSGESD